jgi:hypothetical protein
VEGEGEREREDSFIPRYREQTKSLNVIFGGGGGNDAVRICDVDHDDKFTSFGSNIFITKEFYILR